jgi:hypothetical protein
MECVYNLVTFGIPREAIPIQDDGTVDLSNHHEMLKTIQNREERTKPSSPPKLSSIVEPPNTTTCSSSLVPGTMDVIMGRGRRPKSQPGALRMHHFLLEYRDAYDAGTKWEKTVVSETIVRELKILGCRFLTPTPLGFVECDNAAIRAKISHGFRNLRNKTKGDNNNNTQTTETKAKKRNFVET